jgi:hypothetical protein
MRGAPGANRKSNAPGVCGRTQVRVEMNPDSRIGTSIEEKPPELTSHVTLFASDTYNEGELLCAHACKWRTSCSIPIWMFT